jgi:lipopolysaccharide/colanic/teichoic acid biosynthesis glycosyltransferase
MRDPTYRRVSRVVDVVVSGMLLVSLSPVLLVTAVAVRLDSPGPALFRQERIGLGGRPFTMLKFRTMTDGADESVHRALVLDLLRETAGCEVASAVPVYKVAHDARVTRLGRVLRASSIDELPQLLNVLRGEMALVGPRPDVPYAVEAYKPWQRRRLDVKPGITGLWQVSGRAHLSPARMLELDVYYVDHRSLGMDLRILARTLPAVLRRVGSC